MRLTREGKKRIKRVWILALVYLVAVIGFFFVFSTRETEDLSVDLSEASMPVVSTEYNGMLLNRANGYSAQMDATYLRDCITPVDDDRTLSLRVDTYGATVMALYYELRSMDGERLLENYDIEDWTQSDDAILFDVTLQNLMEAGQDMS